jgi:hypothetical protein
MPRSSRPLLAAAIASTVSRTIGWRRVCWGAIRRASWRYRSPPALSPVIT